MPYFYRRPATMLRCSAFACLFMLLAGLFFTTCRGAFTETNVNIIPPEEVRDLVITGISSNSFTLTWTNPSAQAFSGVEITVAEKGSLEPLSAITLDGLVPDDSERYPITGLLPETEYTVIIITLGVSGSRSSGKTETVITATLDEVQNLEIKEITPFQFTVYWVNPIDPDFKEAEITLTRNGTSETLPLVTLSGAPGDAGNHTFSGLVPETGYTVCIVTVSNAGKRSPGVTDSVTTGSAAWLLRFEVTGYTLSPPFSPEITVYTLDVPMDVTSVTLVANLNPQGGSKITGGSSGLIITTPENVIATMTMDLSSGSALGEVMVFSNDGSYFNTYRLTVTRRGSVSINAGEETIEAVISPAPGEGQNLNLSKTGTIQTATITIPDASGIYSAVSWNVDGAAFTSLAKTGTQWKINLDAADYGIKDSHELIIMVIRDGIPYTGSIYFNVTL